RLDAQSPRATRTGLADHDLHVPSEDRHEAKQPFHGIVAEVASQQARHVGLRNAKQFRCARLGEAPFTDDLIDPSDKLCLQKMRFCIRPAEVGEDVPGPGLDMNIVLLAHRLEPFPYVAWWCCSAALSLRFTRSISAFGVAIPLLDF